ncbi:MAG: HAD-IG family 5'-nucleotidase [Bdellovibrionales bacterium]
MHPNIFVNRTLNLKKIKYIGFDMDHTLVRYHSKNFEKLAHTTLIEKLIKNLNYPKELKKLPFAFDRAIRGLVIDKKNGNLLKLSRWGAIRISYHGTQRIDFDKQKEFYKSTYIDLRDPHYSSIDTAFSIAFAVLYAQLVDFKDKNLDVLPDYESIANDLNASLDAAHRDGSLKNAVEKDLAHYIKKDAQTVKALERFKKLGKTLFVLTNSDFYYTKLLLDYAINPYLKDHKSWHQLFEYTFTHARKPRFFFDKQDFLKVNIKDGSLTNHYGPLGQGVYQGGCANDFTTGLGLNGDDVLYIGDHIYSDILRIKKDCNWRTALVVEELDYEIEKLNKAQPIDEKIAQLMDEKEPFEDEVVKLVTLAKEQGRKTLDDKKIIALQEKIKTIDKKISPLIQKHEELFNPYWGEVMRAGNEESYFARQMQSFACIYMADILHFLNCSPRIYFRAPRRLMPHEL